MNLDELTKQVPNLKMATDADSLKKYGKDWTKHLIAKPSAVLFPTSTEEVKAIVDWARKTKTALIPSGGRTGLSGAATALNNEVIVSFEKMNRVLEFDAYDMTVTCEPGLITETLQKYAEEKGLYYPVDFAARGSSHIGGNIATNAGGIKVLRYGMTRNWVTALEVVTGAGEVLQLNQGLIKNATGYDFRQLFIGSEGTLGFITKATMQLTKKPADVMVFVFALPELDSLMKVYHLFKSEMQLVAFEMFTDLALQYVQEHTHLPKPCSIDAPFYVVMEVEKTGEDVEAHAMQAFEDAVEKGWILDGVLAQSPAQARDFWRLREDITESTSMYQPYKNDVSVRISKVPAFLLEMDALLKNQYPDFNVVWFGHIGDGNLHINILKPENLSSEEFMKRCKHVDELLFKTIQKYHGSVSAEHGVGLTKKPYLSFTRSQAEIQLMRNLKKLFDPDLILNPGKIFD